MGVDRLQLQRLELKYLVSEEKALAVRDFVRAYLELDEYGAGCPDYSYPIHSLYLDSSELSTYWETINGSKNRFKLRIRYYDDRPTSPAFFEIKRRNNDAILKQRAGVRREAVTWLLAGHLPEPSHLLRQEAGQLGTIERFYQLMAQLGAQPTAHVAYVREAWITTVDNSVRVTMDRRVRVAPQLEPVLTTQSPLEAVAPFGDQVVLELKFTGRHPNWFGDLVRAFDLWRCAAAKYAEGLYLYGEEHFRRREAAPVPLTAAAPKPAAAAAWHRARQFRLRMPTFEAYD